MRNYVARLTFTYLSLPKNICKFSVLLQKMNNRLNLVRRCHVLLSRKHVKEIRNDEQVVQQIAPVWFLKLYYDKIEQRLPELFAGAHLGEGETEHALYHMVNVEVALNLLAKCF